MLNMATQRNAARRLAKPVAVNGAWYGPGDDIPDEVAEKITNPKAWASDTDADDKSVEDKPMAAGTAAGAKLATRVAVDGVWYGPDDAVPDEVAEKITNPKAWEGGKLPGAVMKAAEKTADTEVVENAIVAEGDNADKAAAEAAAAAEKAAAEAEAAAAAEKAGQDAAEPADGKTPARKSTARR